MIGLLQTIDKIIEQIPEPRMFKGLNGYYKEAEEWVRKQYPYMEAINQESFKDAVTKKYCELIWSPQKELDNGEKKG